MLIFTRRISEKIIIGDEIVINLVGISKDGRDISISVTAPDMAVVHKGETVPVHAKHNRPMVTVKKRSRLLMAAEASAKK